MAPSVTINTMSSRNSESSSNNTHGSSLSPRSCVTTITLNSSNDDAYAYDGAEPQKLGHVDIEGFVHQGYCRTTPNVDLYYALYGTGPVKVVLLMGIATSGHAWKHNIEWFVKHPQYQVCAVDNRGCGRTKGPTTRLTTSMMAQDVIALLRFLKWEGNQQRVHLVGNSLGGMIAQEVAIAVPDSLASLTLIATHAGGWKTKIPPLSAMLSIGSLLFARDELHQTELILGTVFSKSHLAKAGKASVLSCIKQQVEYPSILDFYHDHANAAFDKLFCKENAPVQFMQQLGAVLTHWVDAKRLEEVRNKVPSLVITGTGDKIVDSSHSYWLADALNANLIKFQNAGHAVSEECLDEVNMALHKHFSKHN